MISFDSFTQASFLKIFLFILLSFFSGSCLILFPDVSLFISLVFTLLFFIGVVFSAFLSPSSFVSIGFVFLYFIFAQILGFSSLKFIGVMFLGLSSLLIFISIFNEKKNNINLQFFKTVSSCVSKGIPFFILGILFLFSSSFSIPSILNTYVFDSPFLQKSINDAISTSTDSNESKSFQSSLITSFTESFRPKIEVLCENNKACIEEKMKEINSSVGSSQNLSPEEKDELVSNASETLKTQILLFFEPEKVSEFVEEKNIPFLENFSGEELLQIISILLLFFIIVPFSFLFALIISLTLSVFFFLFLSLGVVSLHIRTVSQQYMY